MSNFKFGKEYENAKKETYDIENRPSAMDIIRDRRKNIMLKKTGSKTKYAVELPTYKVEEKDPTYKLRRGKVMEAHSNLHADKKTGKRTITTKMKIWDKLTPSDKSDLKKSIMLALEHKFSGGSINDIPKDLHKIINKVNDHIEEMKHGMGLFDKPIGLATNAFNTLKKAHSDVTSMNEKINKRLESRKKGTGMFENYFKPKGQRQLIFFSDSSSSDDEPQLPIKRGRGRPKCS